MTPRTACIAAAASLLAAAIASPASSRADIAPQALAKVGVHAAAGARAPLDARFLDQDGRPVTLGETLGGAPTVLLFEDYRCTTLCGPALSIVAHALRESGLRPGREVGLTAVGLNPRETPSDARRLRDARLAEAPGLRATARFLSGSETAVVRTTAAMGYGYAYDRVSGQYTHPVAAFVLTPDGRLSRVLDQINMTGPGLRTAVREAGRGALGSVVDQLALLCHGISLAAGRYNGVVALGLKLGALATLAAMAGGLGLLIRRRAAA